MRIDRVHYKGYRVYEDARFDFEPFKDTDLHIIIGDMGTGKTTFMTGLTYMLYGTEYSKASTETKPVLNDRVARSTEGSIPVEMAMRVSSGADEWDLTKSVWFTKVGGGWVHNAVDSLQVIDGKGIEEDAEHWVSNFIPEKIKEFFFFDGEDLRKYFEDEQARNVKSKLEVMLAVDELMEIRDLLRDYRRKVVKKVEAKNRVFGRLLEEKERLQREIEGEEELIKNLKSEITRIDQERRQIELALMSESGNVKKLDRMDKIEKEMEDLQKEIALLFREISDDVIGLYAMVLLGDEINELYRRYSSEDVFLPSLAPILRYAVRAGVCPVCEREIRGKDLEKIKQRLREAEEIDQVGRLRGLFMEAYPVGVELMERRQELMAAVGRLTLLKKRKEELAREKRRLKKRIRSDVREEIPQKRERLKELGRLLGARKHQLETAVQRLERLNVEMARLEKRIKSDRKKIGNDPELVELEYGAIELLLDKLDEVLTGVMEEVKAELVERINRWFSFMMWKDVEYAVQLDDDFRLKVVEDGAPITDSLSGGEKQTLALAYVLALHDVMGYASPIIADRISANISGESLKNLAEAVVRVSESRQVILLFTTADWNNVKEFLAPYASTIWCLEHDDKVGVTVPRRVLP